MTSISYPSRQKEDVAPVHGRRELLKKGGGVVAAIASVALAAQQVFRFDCHE